ncbi:hypothetical protein ACO0R3_002999 [Hanseniaspora guilliermondii]
MNIPKQNGPCKVTLSITLDYQYQILQEMIILQNCMLILCKGLDLYLIISNLLFLLSIGNDNKKPFILIINSDPSIDDQIVSNFKELILNNSSSEFIKDLKLPIKMDNILTNKRESFYKTLYAQGGLLSVSPTILIVDILNGIIDLNKVTGLFIIKADLLIEQPFNNIVFIVEHFKKNNNWGFVKCISENVNNFLNLEQPLVTASKTFFIDRYLIYPRFHETIMNDLNYMNNSTSSLIEVKIPPTQLMLTLQHSISDMINKCINELIVSIKNLKSIDPTLNFINDFQEEKTILIQTRHHSDNLDPELQDKLKNSIKLNYLNDNFIKYLNMKLEPYEHLLSSTSRNLRKDINQLREFIFQIYTLDAVEFYRRLKHVIDMSNNHEQTSLWILTQEANTVINAAKKRLIDNNKSDKFVLELQPKWVQLKNIIKECEEEKRDKNDNSPILVMCQDLSTLYQIKKIISNDNLKKFMKNKLKLVIYEQKLQEKTLKNTKNNYDQTDDIQLSTTFTKNPLNVQTKIKYDPNKRRRMRSEESISHVQNLWKNGGDGDINLNDVVIPENEEEILIAEDGSLFEVDEIPDINIEEAILGFLRPNDSILVCKYGSEESQNVLNTLQPRYVILYEPNLEFIRKLDLYKQIHRNTKIFMLYYRDTIEEQNHLTQLKREKKAFVKLLKEKNSIPKFFMDYTSQVLRTDQDGIAGDISSFDYIVKEKNYRNASENSNKIIKKPPTVIIDTREFRSPLPGLLSRLGNIIVKPAFLVVGDYILTPEIAVERKSIPDLTNSLKNKKLHKQLRSMKKHYKRVVLLIEFQFGERFRLQDYGDMKVMDQLCQLVMELPFVRVIWSNSPLQTVNIFLSLKSGQFEPDYDEAIGKKKTTTTLSTKASSFQSKLFIEDNDEDHNSIVPVPAEEDIYNDQDTNNDIDIKDVVYNFAEISQLQAYDVVNHFKTWDKLVSGLDELNNVLDADSDIIEKIKSKIKSLTE